MGNNTIRGLQREIAEWADGVFPHRTIHDVLAKLVMEEIPELLLSLKPEEFADLLVLALDGANLLGIDVQQAVHDKMAINRARTWAIDPATGLLKHVKESNETGRLREQTGAGDMVGDGEAARIHPTVARIGGGDGKTRNSTGADQGAIREDGASAERWRRIRIFHYRGRWA
jgi:NTP pyrophosphatase (non-canonical NTP hydrolase)